MLTLRAASRILARADSLDNADPIARLLGFTGKYSVLSSEELKAQGMGALADEARIYERGGGLRLCTALLTHASHHTLHGTKVLTRTPRELTRRLGVALHEAAPNHLWCLITIDATRRFVSIATVDRDGASTRVSTLCVERDNVLDTDADTLRLLSAPSGSVDMLRHARLTGTLQFESIAVRFHHELSTIAEALSRDARGSADDADRHELALILVSRILFLAFLQEKGWLDGKRDFLLRQCTTHLHSGKGLHRSLVKPLFFGTLNTPHMRRSPASEAFGQVPFLGGELFSPTAVEKRHRHLSFPDDALVALITGLLGRYRFIPYGTSYHGSEVVIDLRVLARSFEYLLADDEGRGSPFRPSPGLVDTVVTDALSHALPEIPRRTISDPVKYGEITPGDASVGRLGALRILDPACGSGTFLVSALERIAALRILAGDKRPVGEVRRDVLMCSIFGVDRKQKAVWLSRLMLSLSSIIESDTTDPTLLAPLPNLDRNIRMGDALAGGSLSLKLSPKEYGSDTSHEQYARMSGTKKLNAAKRLDTTERRIAVALLSREIGVLEGERSAIPEPGVSMHGEERPRGAVRRNERNLSVLRLRIRELETRRASLGTGSSLPFRFASHFPGPMSEGGFSLILGNPPWARPHTMSIRERARLRGEFRTIRESSWRTGAARTGASTGFAAQADLSVAFVERSLQLLKEDGCLALLVPGKLWRSLSGGGMRRLLFEGTRLHLVRDWSSESVLHDGATTPSLVVASKANSVRHGVGTFPRTPPVGRDEVHSGAGTLRATSSVHENAPPPLNVRIQLNRAGESTVFAIPQHQIAAMHDVTAPWLLLPAEGRRAFRALSDAGTPLAETHMGRPIPGVRCGCNAAYLVEAIEGDDDIATISSGGRKGVVERAMLRPVLKREDLAQCSPEGGMNEAGAVTAREPGEDVDRRIIWTHSHDGRPFTWLPPATRRWFIQWRYQLESRRGANRRGPWWQLFRTDAARSEGTRLVWGDTGPCMRTAVLHEGDPTVPLNGCYVLHMPSAEDAFALNALLTSPAAEAWISCISEPARAGLRRYMAWTIAAFPVPERWIEVRTPLARLGEMIARGHFPDAATHCSAVAEAYRLAASALEPLLEWSAA